MKTAIITSIENVDQRATARGVVRYRRLVELLLGLGISPQAIISSVDPFRSILEQHDIVSISDAREYAVFPYRGIPYRTYFIKYDGTFFEARISFEMLTEYESDWDCFKAMKPQIREIIFDALQEMLRPTAFVRYRNKHIEDFVASNSSESTGKDDFV